jgi:hypothetical protein
MTLEELQRDFKPEFGNQNHIYILELSRKASRKRELVKKTKSAKTQLTKLLREAEEAEKKLYSALKWENDKKVN